MTNPLTPHQHKIAIEVRGLRAGYGQGDVLNGVNMSIFENQITAIIGPSGCGKSTLIRCMNRMHEIHVSATNSGEILLGEMNIFNMDAVLLRQQVGMNKAPLVRVVDQKPLPGTPIAAVIAGDLVLSSAISTAFFSRATVFESNDSCSAPTASANTVVSGGG